MGFDSHSNFAYSTVATAPSPATSGTSLVVGSGEGSRFPTPPFNITIWPASATPTPANAEIARVTDISTDTLTIARAQEGSSARSVGVGDQVAATITKKTLTDLEGVDVVPHGANDDEFEQNTSGVPSGWTAFGANSLVACNTNTVPGCLYIKSETARSSAWDWQGIYKSTPSIPYTITSKMAYQPRLGSAALGGLLIMDGTTTGPMLSAGVACGDGGKVSSDAWTNWTTLDATNDSTFGWSSFVTIRWTYIKVIVHAANNIDVQISYDGILWENIVTSANFLSNSNHIGIGVAAYSVQTELIVDWIRFS